MTGEQDPSPVDAQGQLDREAAQWCVRMHGEDADRWREAFEHWLGLGALHRRAYNRIEEVYLLAGRTGHALDSPVVRSEPTGAKHRSGAPLALAGLGAASLVALATIGYQRSVPRPDPGPPIAAIDQARFVIANDAPSRFALADGSTIALARRSRVRVVYAANERRIVLDAGGGRFAVARDRRPFIVSAGGGSVTARDTLFDMLSVAGARIDVHLIEGRADVVLPGNGLAAGATLPHIVHLAPGDRISYPIAQRLNDLPASPTSDRRAVDQPHTVGELADLANQLPDVTEKLMIEDAGLRAVRLSGTFKVHAPAVVADRLNAMLGLAVDRSRPGVIVLRRRSSR